MFFLSNEPAEENDRVKVNAEEEAVPDYSATEEIRAKNRRFFMITLCAALIFTVARMIFVRFYTDPKTGFYAADMSGLLPVFDYIVAAAVIVIFAARFFFYKNKETGGVQYAEVYAEGSLSIVFASATLGFLFLFAAVMESFSIASSFLALKIPASSFFDYVSKNAVFDFLSVLAAIPAAVYFFKMAAKPQNISENMYTSVEEGNFFGEESTAEKKAEEDEKTRNAGGGGYLFLSLFPVFWTYCRLLACFFDMKSPINSTSRMYEISSLVALMLFFVSQSRMISGNRYTRAYMTFGYISLILLVMSGLPSLIFSTFWYLEIRHLAIYYAIYLAMALHVAAHIHSQINYSRYAYLREPKE